METRLPSWGGGRMMGALERVNHRGLLRLISARQQLICVSEAASELPPPVATRGFWSLLSLCSSACRSFFGWLVKTYKSVVLLLIAMWLPVSMSHMSI